MADVSALKQSFAHIDVAIRAAKIQMGIRVFSVVPGGRRLADRTPSRAELKLVTDDEG